ALGGLAPNGTDRHAAATLLATSVYSRGRFCSLGCVFSLPLRLASRQTNSKTNDLWLVVRASARIRPRADARTTNHKSLDRAPGDRIMREEPPSDNPALTPSMVHRVDQACDRFEAAWKTAATDQRPRIEDYVDEVAE